MRNIKLIIEYDGTNYSGWQSQANATAIQDVLSKAIARMVEEPVSVIGASRTDAGVHALGQVATFQTSREIPCDGFLKGLNCLLPEDIRVKQCEEVSHDFHPIRHAKNKEYQYVLEVSQTPSAIWRLRSWWVGPTLDIAAMQEAAEVLVGEHDFVSFQGALSDTKTTVRRLDTIWYQVLHGKLGAGFQGEEMKSNEISNSYENRYQVPGGKMFVSFTFRGNGFLKYMARNIVGTLVEIGLKRMPVTAMQEILEAKDRRKAGPTALPQGLYLVKVNY
ncbi:MAG: tRNA pseudouridine(38-40) synthase TruA [Deltaproteobacteria bacterium RIFCSPLOWO2_12_FULL_44_12]|nr:MAG: tRNA pseudouridine(38-40) synthase TruA [Deltaproteobacteria bacterium RIFCSPHIGHO2_01_FULL_43_49]OGQ16292.1 MAG: tRNA pseudouridine(38-40) synthase TruA [Deltaproteobacteria bacterium RIFCSPHIGHO2_02_FULL_44_53]OGQ29252.1 MAG: tRNA pseudouridine(38-40) synthase TruA [Deltaproteobacteria bacterium RIFCSPHIGHO2_12_FULL_44_21]OGQ32809.1 MAG: tRNA pseudouridine(38-40) synthase TruA [Deltaproteobacteria bacterium RIFCSPLOWO2_01_FULL_45_74]OGQ41910.1 MAG: tRNA pseudouridine(38-40) synthase T